MGKTVTHAIEFHDPRQMNLGPDRLLFLLLCDDGSVYEFQRMSDSPRWSLRARGDTDTPRDRWTQSRAALPTDVRETLDDELGESRWSK